ncbi:Flp family type IVb pilin [Sphingomonas sp. RP10(2022)]|uniref:Flp family type IVb pilin n=1 Tax=Sphingomonas liriopis TaxID=2949094 RepID=A0A9X2HQK1_9SPHN|nr:Flp family type IVb pilin [Sphingomonas liriopis]MCP3735323.1 Flp family type IVb pilin [Sphingomonas liriopis]
MTSRHPLLRRLFGRLTPALRDVRGATAVEYGLILAMIVVVMIVALKGLAGVTVGMWTDVSTKVISAK